MSGVLIKNVEYQGEIGDYLVSNRYLTRVDAYDRIIDGTGLVVVPAFRDRHVHFRDPGFTEKEDLLSGMRAAAAGGYHSVECEPNTNPVIDSVEAFALLSSRLMDLNVPIVAEQKVALTIGQRGEELVDIAALSDEYVVNFSSDGEPVANRELLVRALRLTEGYARIDLHCEETPRSAAEVERALGPGPAMAREPELIRLALSALAEADAGVLHIQHVSLAESVRLIAEAKRQGLPVTAEVTPHHLLLCEEDIPPRNGARDPNWKMNPPLRGREDMLAVRRALADGIIDIIATDHAPHTPAEKARGWDDAPFGVIGLESAFGACMSLVHGGELSFARLIAAMTGFPVLTGDEAECLELQVREMFVSNVTLIDPNHVWTVDPDKFYSKSRNCPFAGMTFKGKVIYTIVDGQLVMAEGEVLL